MRSCVCSDSPRLLHFPPFAVHLLSYHPVFPPGHQLHLPRCGGQIPCALQLMRTLAPLPSTTLSHQWYQSERLCIDSENAMATAEQMQEALQQLQVLGARIAALETQLQLDSARAQTAERERSALTQTLGAMRTDRGGAMVDTTGIGQPFMLKGTADQDFGEWTHRVRTFMLGRFGEQILGAVFWHHVNGKSLSRVADLRRVTASHPGLMSLEKMPMRRTRSTRSMISLESSTHTLSLSQPTQPTRRRQRLGSLETTAQRARPHVVHETSGDSSAGSEPTALSAS